MFDLDSDLVVIVWYFVGDFLFGLLVVVNLGLCLLVVFDFFEQVVCVIVGQQVMVKVVVIIIGCLIQCFGELLEDFGYDGISYLFLMFVVLV